MVSCSCELKKKPTKMTSSQGVLLRASIVLGMAAAVVTILYLTPMPGTWDSPATNFFLDQNFKSCDRPCHELDWPMICRVKLNIEMYQTTENICQDCFTNTSTISSNKCNNIFCQSRSNSRGIIIANRQLPGPSIQVCQNDILVVDVINKMPGHNLAIHWRGQPNHEAPFMDGVPMVTQCPIPSYTTFQYKFRASEAGTHFYHAFGDTDRSDGLFGALIVRQADKVDPLRKLYDIDSKKHIVLISEWSGHTSSENKYLLINGRAPSEVSSSLTTFIVKKDKRHRFRVAYTAGSTGCPISLSIEGHLIRVIAVDGRPITPHEVTSVTMAKGERIDFVLKANRVKGTYYLVATPTCDNETLNGVAAISYEGSSTSASNGKLISSEPRVLDTSSCRGEIGKVCLGDLKSTTKMPKELAKLEVDSKIYLEVDSGSLPNTGVYGGLTKSKIYKVNNFTFTYPSSPLLTQPHDVQWTLICNLRNVPENCSMEDGNCECVHVENISLGSTVEVLIINKDDAEHIFHLHGYYFYVVGAGTFEKGITGDGIKALDTENKLLKRSLRNPVSKDTIRVARGGVVALRFLAKNPGFWMLRDEKSKGWTRGLDVIFQVGSPGDMVATPSNFPTCGSYIGPDFFLL